jgi:hypothetical protein
MEGKRKAGLVSMIEDCELLNRLCWLLNKRFLAEQEYARAQWQVAYYRRIKGKIKHGHAVFDPDIEVSRSLESISKKIEIVRLKCLKKQEQLLKAKKKLAAPIGRLAKTLKADFCYKDGTINAIQVKVPIPSDPSHTWRNLYLEKIDIIDRAEEYMFSKILEKELTYED